MVEALRNSDWLQVRCTAQDSAIADTAAKAQGTTVSAWIRQAIRTVAQLQGIDPATIAPRDAGALYDSVEGRKRYAMIEGGQVVFLSYGDAKPDDGRTWLPVVHVDSAPFDIDRHWRLPPVYQIEAERVLVTYPVILKSLEAI